MKLFDGLLRLFGTALASILMVSAMYMVVHGYENIPAEAIFNWPLLYVFSAFSMLRFFNVFDVETEDW